MHAQPIPRALSERERTVHHELGHALVAWHLGCEILEIRVRRGGDESAGVCEYSRPRGRAGVRSPTKLRHSGDMLIAIAMAGMAAEAAAEGPTAIADDARISLCADDALLAVNVAREILGDVDNDVTMRLFRCMREATRLLRLEVSRGVVEALFPELVTAGAIDGRRIGEEVARRLVASPPKIN